MFICLIIAILSTLKWIDTLIIESINAKINPYQKSDEDKKHDQVNAILRTACVIISSIFWGAVIYYWN